MPKVSIILPAYNGDKFLDRAVQSVLGQSFADFELIAVNDGSTDGTAAVLEKLKNTDSRVKILTHEKNLGLVASLNDALTKAGGVYIARIDCDDVWSSQDKLKKQVEFLDANSDCGLVGTWAEFVDLDGKHLKDYKLPTTDTGIRQKMLFRNCFVHSSILARKTNMLEAGGYSTSERHVEDYGLWLRMGLRCKLGNLSEYMVRYLVNTVGVTQTNNIEQVERILKLIKIFKKNYPNFQLGNFKWRLQKLVSKIF